MSTDQIVMQRNVQQNVYSFVELLPKHVVGWKLALEEFKAPVQALLNQAEQLRHVEMANVSDMENFRDTQENLRYYISRGIEEELATIKYIVARVNKLNQDLKNKLSCLENSTIDIDWSDTSELLSGTGVQPPLNVLLSEGLAFYTFFTRALKNITHHLKHMDVRIERSMLQLKKTFDIDLDDRTVRYYLALTQYINNDTSIV